MSADAPPGSFGGRALALAARHSQFVQDTLNDGADAPLATVFQPLRTGSAPPLQSRDGLWAVVAEQAALGYGEQLARDAVEELRADPTVPTSNHFGVDTFADSVQGTLLFALRPGVGRRRRTVVVFGCGSISLDNLTYPMGLRLYDPRGGDLRRLPQLLPVFGNRWRRCVVAAAPPFDQAMVTRARQRLARERAAGEVSAFAERATGRVLEEDYAAADVLAEPSYGRQGQRINSALWARMLAGTDAPRLVQLELESVASALLRAEDLRDPDSLLGRLLFVPPLREALLRRMDRGRACWDLAELERRLHDPAAASGTRGGTVFFWGLTDDGRRVPVTLRGDRLVGVDSRHRRRDWPFTPTDLTGLLESGRLVPSLFSCFTALALARAVSCVGGYYQAQYLPEMQQGVVDVLRPVDPAAAAAVAAVPTGQCLASLQFAVRMLDGVHGVPAGPLEIAEAGGLSPADLDHIGTIPVREAYLAAFPEVLAHIVPAAELPPAWTERLCAEIPATCPHLVRLTA